MSDIRLTEQSFCVSNIEIDSQYDKVKSITVIVSELDAGGERTTIHYQLTPNQVWRTDPFDDHVVHFRHIDHLRDLLHAIEKDRNTRGYIYQAMEKA